MTTLHKAGWIAATALLALTACDKGVKMENASVADVAAATKDAQFITPGQWTTTTEILSVDLSGLPEREQAAASAVSKAMTGHKQSFSTCVSEEEAKRPAAGLFAGGDKGDCRYDSFAMSGGKMAAAMTCTPKGQPNPMKMTMAGTYSGTDYAMDVTMKMEGPGGPALAFKAKNNGKRTGDCTEKKS